MWEVLWGERELKMGVVPSAVTWRKGGGGGREEGGEGGGRLRLSDVGESGYTQTGTCHAPKGRHNTIFLFILF